MNIVEILRAAIDRLPVGDHSTGLYAIMRHVDSAIRHFDRNRDEEPDRYTDAIYRANQAYEGSLKEAYRVLAEKDPSGKTTHEIEQYLESNAVIRPRVLTQLTRYRQDYRNPSTHDYKLDFDENEALLAIVSVCAFAKLLIDQISSKLAFKAASAAGQGAGTRQRKSPKSLEEFTRDVFATVQKFLAKPLSDDDIEDLDSLLAGTLDSAGYTTRLLFQTEIDDSAPAWDILVTKGEYTVGLETRHSANDTYTGLQATLAFITSAIERDERVAAAIVVLVKEDGADYETYQLGIKTSKPVFIATRMRPTQLKRSAALLKNIDVSAF